MTGPDRQRRRLVRFAAVWALPITVAAVWIAVRPPSAAASSAASSSTTSTTAAPPGSSAVSGASASPGSYGSGVPASSKHGGAVSGAVEYQDHCASCHGVTARGTQRGPSLVGVGEAAVDFELTTGRMPKKIVTHKPEPFVAILPENVIKALDQYVTKLAAHGGPSIPSVAPASGDIATGGVLFRDYCAGCHTWGGVGSELTNRPIPPVTEATNTQIAEALRVGPAQMPVFGTEQLSAKEVDSIVDYVDYTKHMDNRGGDGESHWGPVADGAVTWLVGMLFLLGFIRWVGKRG